MQLYWIVTFLPYFSPRGVPNKVPNISQSLQRRVNSIPSLGTQEGTFGSRPTFLQWVQGGWGRANSWHCNSVCWDGWCLAQYCQEADKFWAQWKSAPCIFSLSHFQKCLFFTLFWAATTISWSRKTPPRIQTCTPRGYLEMPHSLLPQSPLFIT